MYAHFSLSEFLFHFATNRQLLLSLVLLDDNQVVPVIKTHNHPLTNEFRCDILRNWIDAIFYERVVGVIAANPTITDLQNCESYMSEHPGIMESIIATFHLSNQIDALLKSRIHLKVFTKKGKNSSGKYYDAICIQDEFRIPPLIPSLGEFIQIGNTLPVVRVIEKVRFTNPDLIEIVIDEVFDNDRFESKGI